MGEVVADLLLMLGAIAVLLGFGNLFAILVPYPAAVPGKNLFPQISQKRLLVVNLFQLLFLVAVGNFLLPLLAGRYALSVFEVEGWAWRSVAVAMSAYGFLLYAALLGIAAKAMLAFEPRIFEKLQKSNA